MKSAETHTTSTQHRPEPRSAEGPFFQREGERGFFGGERAEQPFFSPQGVQPKLKIGAPDDAYEREADQVADRVVQRLAQPGGETLTSEPSIGGVRTASVPASPTAFQPVQRQSAPEADEELQTQEEGIPIRRKAIFDSAGEEESVQRKCAACAAEEEGGIRRMPQAGSTAGAIWRKCTACAAQEEVLPKRAPGIQRQGDGGLTANEAFSSRLQSTQGRGAALPATTRSSMEGAMGADLSGVRVHTGGEAAGLSQSIGAQAFTHGSDIYFNRGKYDPESTDGQRLLAHELTHTVQQGGGAPGVQRETTFPAVPAPEELEEAPAEKPNEETATPAEAEVAETGPPPAAAQGAGVVDIPPPIPIEEEGPQLARKVAPGADLSISTSGSPLIQRFEAAPQDVETMPVPEPENEGKKVVDKLDAEVADADYDEDDEISREEKLGEASELENKGATTPDKDHGAEAKATSEAQREQINQKVNEETPTTETEASGEPSGEQELSSGEQAEAEARQRNADAQALAPPVEPQPFQHPDITTPKDSEDDELPNDPQTDQSVIGLGLLGEMFREEGYRLQLTAYEHEKSSIGFRGVLALITADVSFAEDGVTTLQETQDLEQESNETASQALVESKERKDFVAKEAAVLEETTAEKIAETKELREDAESKAGEAESNRPDDEDAKADAEKQEAELNESVDGSTKVDDAMTGAHAQVQQFKADAVLAEEKNAASEASIQERTEVLTQKQQRIGEMRDKNAQTRQQLEQNNPKPATLEAFAQQDYADGAELIETSQLMQDDLKDIQKKYLDESKEVPGKEEIARRELEAAEEQRGADEEIDELLTISQMEPADQEAYAAQLPEDRKTRLLDRLDLLIQADEEAAQQNQPDGENGEAGEPEEPQDKRAPWYLMVQNLRKGRLQNVFGVANNKMSFLSTAQKRALAQRIEHATISNDISNIVSWQSVKAMLHPYNLAKGIVMGPWEAIKGIADKSKKWGELWDENPLGAVLQAAADITTGLAVLFSSIVALAGIVAVVLTIAGFFFPPLLVPVPYLGTVITYASWGAIITGLLAVDFNQLAYMKNLSEAGTAETAEELFENAGEMKQNTYDSLQGAMAVVEGIGGVKMGAGLKSSSQALRQSLPRGLGGRMSMLKDMGKAAFLNVVTAPARFMGTVARLFGRGKAGLKAFRDYLRRLFARPKSNKPDIDLDADGAPIRKPGERGGPPPHRRRDGLDDSDALNATKNKQVLEEGPQLELEMEAVHSRTPGNQIDETIDGIQYVEEVKLPNGHTWRRRKDGLGWCRWTKKSCYTVDRNGNRVYTAEYLARRRGLPKAKPGHHWQRDVNGKLHHVPDKGYTGKRYSYDYDTGKFVPSKKTTTTQNPFDDSGKLKPNVDYKSGEFGYRAETDGLGRLSRVHTNKLQVSSKPRLPHDPKTPGKLPGDHAGHVFGDRFGGSPNLDNLVSQTSGVNLSTFKKIENQWAKAILEGKKVEVEVIMNYSGGSVRPSSFSVRWKINGTSFAQLIPNV